MQETSSTTIYEIAPGKYEEELIGRDIMFYDGVCMYCNDVVKNSINSDNDELFLFTPLQSDFAVKALGRYGINSLDLHSMYIITGYGTSDEALRSAAPASNYLLNRLHGELKAIGEENFAKPREQQDIEYKDTADNRYERFGKFDEVHILDEEFRKKIIY